MKKKKIVLLLVGILSLLCVSCSPAPQEEEPPLEVEPKTDQMKSICDLAVMDCYYHNVAKYYEKDASGTLWWKKDKHFWIEYSGVVTFGIDVSQIDIKLNGTDITISLPPAKILKSEVDSSTLTKDSFIVDKDSAKVEAEDEVKALEEAQKQLEEEAENDIALLNSVRQQVQYLLEDYINNIGDVSGKKYTIHWIDKDKTDSPGMTESTESTTSTVPGMTESTESTTSTVPGTTESTESTTSAVPGTTESTESTMSTVPGMTETESTTTQIPETTESMTSQEPETAESTTSTASTASTAPETTTR